MFLATAFIISMVAATAQQVEDSNDPLFIVETYMVYQQTLGFEHPRMLELRERLEDATDNDYEFDLAKVQKRFEKLTSDRRVLLKTLGLSHPAVVGNATRLTVMSRLLAGQSATVLQEIKKHSK